jgi:hypothetical protein
VCTTVLTDYSTRGRLCTYLGCRYTTYAVDMMDASGTYPCVFSLCVTLSQATCHALSLMILATFSQHHHLRCPANASSTVPCP